jgi:hypothetical protein
MKKRLISLLTSIMMIFGLTMVVPIDANVGAYTSRTRDEALDWVRSMVGTGIDYDGAYGNQCVDLIKAYYNFLGVEPVRGNGSDYVNNTLPSGWQRIQGAAPQPGDILVYTGGEGGYGHVAIYEADRIHYHQNFYDKNKYPNSNVVQCIGYMYNGLSNPYWGVIRPDFNTNPHTHSYVGTITKQPTCTTTGIKTFTCSCGNAYTEEIPATGHSFINTVVAPTSTQKGYTLHTCSICNYSYEDSYVDSPVLNEDGWYYCDTLPSDIKSDKYTIEYNSSYEKIQQTSPGEEWTNAGVVKNEWQNSGGEYTTETPLDTSDARVLVKECFYHWCIPGAPMGSEGNYEQTSKFNHYDEIVLPNSYVHVRSQGDDNGHTYYLLSWEDGNKVYCHSGEQCDGSWGYHDYRCQAWYKHYVYQDRVKVELYKFTKQSGWKSEVENGADNVVCRYREIEDIKGDLNSDNTLTMTDAVLLQKHLLTLKDLTAEQLKLADMNSDGKVNIFDLALLKESLKQ